MGGHSAKDWMSGVVTLVHTHEVCPSTLQPALIEALVELTTDACTDAGGNGDEAAQRRLRRVINRLADAGCWSSLHKLVSVRAETDGVRVKHFDDVIKAIGWMPEAAAAAAAEAAEGQHVSGRVSAVLAPAPPTMHAPAKAWAERTPSNPAPATSTGMSGAIKIVVKPVASSDEVSL